jgi:hypothetical protein
MHLRDARKGRVTTNALGVVRPRHRQHDKTKWCESTAVYLGRRTPGHKQRDCHACRKVERGSEVTFDAVSFFNITNEANDTMTSSEEVADAIDLVQLLAEKRKALDEARKRYATAKSMRDEEAMSTELRLIGILKESIIPELERDAAAELEAAGKHKALTWLKARAGKLRAADKRVTNAQEKARASLAQLLSDLDEEVTARAEVAKLSVASAVLCARFGITPDGMTAVVLPPHEDYAGQVVRATNVMYRPSQEFKVTGNIASDTPERRRANEIKSAVEFANKYALPADVRSIFAEAPAPAEATVAKAADPNAAVIGTRSLDPVLATAATEAIALAALGMPDGNVHRG